jgi:hypothetical protein
MAPPPFDAGTWRPFILGAHCCSPRATYPGGGPETALRVSSRAAPIRSCSRCGLPCRSRCRKRGGPLPHPFTLARPARRPRQAVCFLWHCHWGRPRRMLSGTVSPWSPDFPHAQPFGSRACGRPASWRCALRDSWMKTQPRRDAFSCQGGFSPWCNTRPTPDSSAWRRGRRCSEGWYRRSIRPTAGGRAQDTSCRT